MRKRQKPTVYLETTIVSYRTGRPSRDLIVAAHQQITRDWFDTRLPLFQAYVSDLVVEEAGKGDSEAAGRRVAALEGLPVLEVSPEALALARELVGAGCVPQKAATDGVHVAIAAVNNLAFLLTWNCVHINNAATKARIASVCTSMGYRCPVICTPEELMGTQR